MTHQRKLVFSLVSLAAIACGQTQTAPTESSNAAKAVAAARPRAAAIHKDLLADLSEKSEKVCAGGKYRCFAHARLNKNGKRFAAAAPSGGLAPADIQSAYALSGLSSTATVAIVDAFDTPTAEADLAVFRKQYGLPACTTANGCFKKVNQEGQASPLPAAATSQDDWTLETSLDLDSVSSACPSCKIVLIEADDDQGTGLMTAINTAASLGATVVSNSWGDNGEDNTSSSQDSQYLTHPGMGIFFASGDNGVGNSYPPVSPLVTSVGGTTLTKTSGGRGWTETVWGGNVSQDGATGSGCSQFESAPSWQSSSNTGCSGRADNDVSADADPASGLAVYDTSNGDGGWNVVGGTSMATPLVAAIYALTGNGAQGPSFSYSNTSAFFDVTSGSNFSNGTSCQDQNSSTTYASQICTARKGWDGPTGNGTPNGPAMAALAGGSGGSTTGGSSSGSSAGGTTTGGSTGGSTGSNTCQSDSDCPDGDVCTNGTCVAAPSGCQSDSDCPSGEVCNPDGSCSAPSSGGNTCDHDDCTQGDALSPSCGDACTQSICDADSYCCNDQWDSICVGEVTSVCGLTCGGNGGGNGGGGNGGGSGNSCDHDEFTKGDALSPSCDPCAATVCGSDSFCCDDKWDYLCVNEAYSWCDSSF